VVVSRVLKNCPQVRLLIIGRGVLELTLKEEVRRLGLERQVRFLGFREDVPELLALSDVFVLPSLSEGLSIALLEGMAAGKPVVQPMWVDIQSLSWTAKPAFWSLQGIPMQ